MRESEQWSDKRKWLMGIVEKLLLLVITGVVSFLVIDRYRAAIDERDTRQVQLWHQIERLEATSLNYGVDMYDSYKTPCGDAGRKSVRRLLDEDYPKLKLEIGRLQRASRLLFDEEPAQEAVTLARSYTKQMHAIYDNFIKERIQCSCAAGSGRLEPIGECAGDRGAFDTEFTKLKSLKAKLMHVMYSQYHRRASRMMSPLVDSR